MKFILKLISALLGVRNQSDTLIKEVPGRRSLVVEWELAPYSFITDWFHTCQEVQEKSAYQSAQMSLFGDI